MSTEPLDAWRRAPGALAGATVVGLGHLPGAPGTFGALAALLPVWLLSGAPLVWRLLPLFAAIPVSIWICHRAGRALEAPDSDRIVLDETIGAWLVLAWWPEPEVWTWTVGLLAFRCFDVFKGPLARYLDEQHPNGFGVVADDLVAALWALFPTAATWWWMG